VNEIDTSRTNVHNRDNLVKTISFTFLRGCHGYVHLFYLYRFRSRFYEVVTVMYICSTCIDFVHVFTRLSRLCTFVLLVSISLQHYALCHAQKAVLSLHVHSCVTIFEIKGKAKYTTRQKSNRKIVKTWTKSIQVVWKEVHVQIK
jgi:hypothetical protein